MSTVLALVMPLGLLLALDNGGVLSVAVVFLLAVSLLAAATAVGQQADPARVMAGDLVTAGRRLRGAFRRLSQPDSPGRPQPRAPGVLQPA